MHLLHLLSQLKCYLNLDSTLSSAWQENCNTGKLLFQSTHFGTCNFAKASISVRKVVNNDGQIQSDSDGMINIHFWLFKNVKYQLWNLFSLDSEFRQEDARLLQGPNDFLPPWIWYLTYWNLYKMQVVLLINHITNVLTLLFWLCFDLFVQLEGIGPINIYWNLQIQSLKHL